MIPVCVFAKAPEPGMVKTRLIPGLGADAAATLAGAMFSDVWNTVCSCPGVRPVLATVASGVFPIVVNAEDIWWQGDGDLGERLERIFCRGLGGAPAAIAVGADSPLLMVSHLEDAIEALIDHDAVIGGSLDGGFYLLGVRKCAEGMLAQLPWSTCETGEATIHRLREQKMVVHELTPLFDVDTPDDLQLLVAHLRSDLSAAPATRAWCKAMNLLGGIA